jgi:hypothetical protein
VTRASCGDFSLLDGTLLLAGGVAYLSPLNVMGKSIWAVESAAVPIALDIDTDIIVPVLAMAQAVGSGSEALGGPRNPPPAPPPSGHGHGSTRRLVAAQSSDGFDNLLVPLVSDGTATSYGGPLARTGSRLTWVTDWPDGFNIGSTIEAGILFGGHSAALLFDSTRATATNVSATLFNDVWLLKRGPLVTSAVSRAVGLGGAAMAIGVNGSVRSVQLSLGDVYRDLDLPARSAISSQLTYAGVGAAIVYILMLVLLTDQCAACMRMATFKCLGRDLYVRLVFGLSWGRTNNTASTSLNNNARWIDNVETNAARAALAVRRALPEEVLQSLPVFKFTSEPVPQLNPNEPVNSWNALVARVITPATHVSPTDCSTECAVCLAEYKDDDSLRKLPCRHYFHQPCIDRWLRTLSKQCPLCKATVTFDHQAH